MRSKEKLLFFGAYLLSVALIIIMLSSFWGGRPVVKEARSVKEGPSANETRTALDDLLHTRMENLLQGFRTAAGNSNKAAGITAMEREQRNFMTLIDSLEKTETVSDAPKKENLEKLLQRFRVGAESNFQLVRASMARPAETQPQTNNVASAELDQLRNQLAEKEATIADLEQQNQAALRERDRTAALLQKAQAAKPSQPRQDASAQEWKRKYDQLKAASDKETAQLNALKNSYKDVVEDNRRLIGQLQTLRAGKN